MNLEKKIFSTDLHLMPVDYIFAAKYVVQHRWLIFKKWTLLPFVSHICWSPILKKLAEKYDEARRNIFRYMYNTEHCVK